MSASLDDVLAALQALDATVKAAVAVSTEIVVGTPEACRRLHTGWVQLDAFVKEGRLKRIPAMRGRGGGHVYAVAELERFARENGVTSSNVVSMGRAS